MSFDSLRMFVSSTFYIILVWYIPPRNLQSRLHCISKRHLYVWVNSLFISLAGQGQLRHCTSVPDLHCTRPFVILDPSLYQTLRCTRPFVILDPSLYHTLHCTRPFVVPDPSLYHTLRCTRPFVVPDPSLYQTLRCTRRFIVQDPFCEGTGTIKPASLYSEYALITNSSLHMSIKFL